jgi:hypothetical protein
VPGFDGVSPVFLLGGGGGGGSGGGGGHWILRDKDIEMYEYTFQFYYTVLIMFFSADTKTSS